MNLTEEELVDKHLPLVKHIANLFQPRDQHQFDDLCQAGLIGLIRGIRKFNPDLEISESTFFYRPIYWEVVNELQRRQCKEKQSSEDIEVSVKVKDFEFLESLEPDEKVLAVDYFIYGLSKTKVRNTLNLGKQEFEDFLSKTEDKIKSKYVQSKT